VTSFTRAIVRPPTSNFADGLTSVALGVPDYQLAIEQHENYCQALVDCGLEVIPLPPDERYPDATFVEDTAVLAGKFALITNPGAVSRKGEETEIAKVLEGFYETMCAIQAPGTLDGGDICDADGHFFIGISHRTNIQGAEQLAGFLKQHGYTSTMIDIRNTLGILHLKSGIAYLGDGNMLVTRSFSQHEALQSYKRLVVPSDCEAYAANCIRVNNYVLFAEGFPVTQHLLESTGYALKVLEVSEFEKMDGGLSCLSLRF